ncbi:MAG: transcription elongation factor GreB [Myxococcales bacterium]|nr:transcription elongation factor GreB [Myxococcales bacterium]
MAVPPNYITPTGLRCLTDEANRLLTLERPRTVREVSAAAAHGDRSDNAEYRYGKKKLREIDRRLEWLSKRLDAARVVDPAVPRGSKVFFGATVDLQDADAEQRTLQLVGEDETDPPAGKVSWRSPIGRALLGRSAGDEVVVAAPQGARHYEILAVRYI